MSLGRGEILGASEGMGWRMSREWVRVGHTYRAYLPLQNLRDICVVCSPGTPMPLPPVAGATKWSDEESGWFGGAIAALQPDSERQNESSPWETSAAAEMLTGEQVAEFKEAFLLFDKVRDSVVVMVREE